MRGTHQELFLLLLRRLVVEPTSLDNLVIDVELVPRAREHGFLNALLRDEPQDTDDLSLTDTMSTILRLEIGMRVPVTVEAGDDVSVRELTMRAWWWLT